MPCGKWGGKKAESCSRAGAEIKMGACWSRRVVFQNVGKEATGVCRSGG